VSEFEEESREQQEVQARIGMKVGTYVLRKCLGMGGMGAVYAAEHPTIGSKVAVKFLHRKYAADPAIVDRFFNEARAVNLIGHENLVKVSDLDHADDGSPYFVMEFLEGQPLAALVGAPQPLEVTGPIFLQACDGLQAAHDKGIVHRDLKPDNLFLVTRHRRGNIVKIVDFGIAKLQGGGAGGAKTSTGMILGTAHYMSPEQAGGEVNKIGPQSDVYAMGVIQFQLATGRLPFDGENLGQIIVGHLTRPAPDPRSVEASVPDDYAAVILKCLEKRIEDRFQSMAELYEAIGAVLDAHGLSRDPPVATGLTPTSGGFPAVSAGSKASWPSRPPESTPPQHMGPPRTPSKPSHPGTELIASDASVRDSKPGFTQVGDRNEVRGHTQVVARDSTPGHTQVAQSNPGVPKTGTAVVPPAFSPLAVQPPPKKSPLVPALVVVALVAAGAAAFVLLGRKAGPPEAAATAAPAAARVTLTFTTTPAGATVQATQGTSSRSVTSPGTLTFEPASPVIVKATLAGHAPAETTVTPGNDQTVALTLLPDVATAAAPAGQVTPTPATKVVAPGTGAIGATSAPSTPAAPPPTRPVNKVVKPKDVGDSTMDVEL